MLIKNFEDLAITKERRLVLEILNSGLEAILPNNYLEKNFKVENEKLIIQDKNFDLKNFDNVYLVGFGKGSALISKIIEEKLGNYLRKGLVIDVEVSENFQSDKIIYFQGTHPLPSLVNLQFTQKVISEFSNLSENDLMIVVVCGGGSAMLISPAKISLEKYIQVNQELLRSGADIYEMNTIRKHLDQVKGGGLAKIFYPAKIISLIFSDVPGNDLSFIASGPTVKDKTTIEKASEIIEKYKISLNKDELIETPKEEKYFEKVENFLMISNLTALMAMKEKAEEFGIKAKIVTDNLKGEVSQVAKNLIEEANSSKENLLLYGGETTVQVKGNGKGGRNQELVLWFLKYLNDKNYLLVSVNSDGWDNSEHSGAIGDKLSLEKVKKLNLNIDEFLENNDSFHFFQKIGDGILTGRLPTNVSDLILLFVII